MQTGLAIPDFIGADDARRPIRHANEFWDHYGAAVHPGNQRPGDLIFFSRHGTFPTHIGIVSSSESYVHAPGKNGTYVSEAAITYCRIPEDPARRPQLYNVNPIGFKAPTVVSDAPDYRYHQQGV